MKNTIKKIIFIMVVGIIISSVTNISEYNFMEYLRTYNIIDYNNPLHCYDYKQAYINNYIPVSWLSLNINDRIEDILQGRNVNPYTYMWTDKYKKDCHIFKSDQKPITNNKRR